MLEHDASGSRIVDAGPAIAPRSLALSAGTLFGSGDGGPRSTGLR